MLGDDIICEFNLNNISSTLKCHIERNLQYDILGIVGIGMFIGVMLMLFAMWLCACCDSTGCCRTTHVHYEQQQNPYVPPIMKQSL